jgi:IS605 OrfB family transposase
VQLANEVLRPAAGPQPGAEEVAVRLRVGQDLYGDHRWQPIPKLRLDQRPDDLAACQGRRQLAKALARCKVMYTTGWWKAKRALSKLEARIAAIRRDALHKATTDLVRHCSAICLEGLNVRGMMANHSLAKAIADVAFGAFRTQVALKATRYATLVVLAPRFFPSSKQCSGCGTIKADLKLGDREWIYPACGECHGRDVNATKNLYQYMMALVPAVRRDVKPVEYSALATGTCTGGETGHCEAGTEHQDYHG